MGAQGLEGLDLSGRVVRLQLVVREEPTGRAVEGVGAALGHEVDPDAARGHLQVAAAGGDVDLLEGIEVVVGRRGAVGVDVGDHDAVQVPLRVAGQRALAHEPGLLAALVARDVDAVHEDAGDGLEHRPRIARLRDLGQLFLGQRGRGAHALGVDHRRLRGDRHFLALARDDRLALVHHGSAKRGLVLGRFCRHLGHQKARS